MAGCSRRGVVPLSFGMDHTGPLVRTVEDCALSMQVLAGYDPPTPAAPVPVDDYISGLRAGWPASLRLCPGLWHRGRADAEALARDGRGGGSLAKLGAEIVEIALPSLAASRRRSGPSPRRNFAIHQQTCAPAGSLWPGDAGAPLLGAFVTGPQYVQAQRLRHSLMREVDALFGEVDAILCAPAHGAAPLAAESDDGPWRRAQPITAAFNVTGHPALCLPAGFAANGLPLSLQIVGRNFDEATVLRIGQAYEQATEWHTNGGRRRPTHERGALLPHHCRGGRRIAARTLRPSS